MLCRCHLGLWASRWLGGAGRSQSLRVHLRIMGWEPGTVAVGREGNQMPAREVFSMARGVILELKKKKKGEFRNLTRPDFLGKPCASLTECLPHTRSDG